MLGFSTKTEVSDVSGRGVGMGRGENQDSAAQWLGQRVPTPGQGSQVVIKCHDIGDYATLMVMLGDQAFAFPLVSVN